MASTLNVKAYFAYWLQLGKKLLNPHLSQGLFPVPVIQGDHYSEAFESCWHYLLTSQGQASYIEGTTATVAQLLSEEWEILPCARCTMPVPVAQVGVVSDLTCPCHDLRHWPNFELPFPRNPVDETAHLRGICNRLALSSPQTRPSEQVELFFQEQRP
jgi:hypothetical protein